jgi:hypothetical protein
MTWDLVVASQVHVLFVTVNLCALSSLFTCALFLRSPTAMGCSTQLDQAFSARMRVHWCNVFLLCSCVVWLVCGWAVLHLPGPMGLSSGINHDEETWVVTYYLNALRLRTNPARLIFEYAPAGFALLGGLWHALFPARNRTMVLFVSIVVVIITTVSEQVPSEIIFGLCIGAILTWVTVVFGRRSYEIYKNDVGANSSLRRFALRSNGSSGSNGGSSSNRNGATEAETQVLIKAKYIKRNKALQWATLFLVIAWFTLQICADKYIYLYYTRMSAAKVLSVHYGGHTILTLVVFCWYLMYRFEDKTVATYILNLDRVSSEFKGGGTAAAASPRRFMHAVHNPLLVELDLTSDNGDDEPL